MVAREENRLACAFDAVPKVDHGMVEQVRCNCRRSDLNGGLGHQRDVFNPCLHFRFTDWKVAVLQLYGHNLLNPFSGNRVERTVQAQEVAGYEVGDEERQTLDVIPVRMGDQHIGRHRQLGQ